MKQVFMIASIAMLLSGSMFAYELNGSVSKMANGSYQVVLSDDDEHEFSGVGINEENGTMQIHVQDAHGVSYTGTGLGEGDGVYDLELKNDATGEPAEGVLEEE